MKVMIKKLHPAAIIPTYATEGAACFDLYSIDSGSILPGITHAPTLRTGLAIQVPEDYVMLAFSRSGHGFKNGIRLANCVGVIDSDYRGEVMVRLQNDDGHQFEIKVGDRIAQAMIIPVSQVSFEVVEELSETKRGDGGFGSTGK